MARIEIEDRRGAELLEAAADWLLELGDQPADVELRGRFEAWLGTSPAHREAWEKTQAMWRRLGQVPEEYERITMPPEEAARPVRRHVRCTGATRRRLPWLGAAAAGLAVCVWLAGPMISIRLQADHLTAAAESQTIELADGSTVVLGADSAIKSTLSATKREVTLLAGEAYFDVAHDAARPFVVETGDVAVEVLGTAFAVNRTDETTEVGLARGQVRATADVNGQRSQTTLKPGEQLTVDNRTGAAVTTGIAVDDIGAWREGRLVITNASVGSVIEVIQRYHPAWIAVPDLDLGARRVSGIYDLRKPDQALAALVGPFGGKVRSVSPLLRVVTRF